MSEARGRTSQGDVIVCPNFGEKIPISAALAAQVRAEVEATLSRQMREQLKRAVEVARAQSREEAAQEIQLLREQLAELRRKAQEARRAELLLRKEKAALEERARELDLEVARRVDAEKAKVEEHIRKLVAEQQARKLREKDKQIEDLHREIAELERKSQQGSQELQGEVLELDIEHALRKRFPEDAVHPVPRGGPRCRRHPRGAFGDTEQLRDHHWGNEKRQALATELANETQGRPTCSRCKPGCFGVRRTSGKR